MVPNTSELLPEPETPVNTVSRRFGISTLTSLRLFTRAPCTRIRSWLPPACSAGDRGSVLVAMLIVSPSVRRGAPGLDLEDLDFAHGGQASCGSVTRASPFLIGLVTWFRGNATWLDRLARQALYRTGGDGADELGVVPLVLVGV